MDNNELLDNLSKVEKLLSGSEYILVVMGILDEENGWFHTSAPAGSMPLLHMLTNLFTLNEQVLEIAKMALKEAEKIGVDNIKPTSNEQKEDLVERSIDIIRDKISKGDYTNDGLPSTHSTRYTVIKEICDKYNIDMSKYDLNNMDDLLDILNRIENVDSEAKLNVHKILSDFLNGRKGNTK